MLSLSQTPPLFTKYFFKYYIISISFISCSTNSFSGIFNNFPFLKEDLLLSSCNTNICFSCFSWPIHNTTHNCYFQFLSKFYIFVLLHSQWKLNQFVFCHKLGKKLIQFLFQHTNTLIFLLLLLFPTGFPVNETPIVSPMPCNNIAPIPTADFIVPLYTVPASVIPYVYRIINFSESNVYACTLKGTFDAFIDTTIS